MKNIFLFIVIITFYSCNKKQEKIKISDITNESNYKITNVKKENDTIVGMELLTLLGHDSYTL